MGATGQPIDPVLVAAAHEHGWQLQSSIARGGFGEVYRAIDAAGRPVALKVLHREVAGSPEATARFEREVAAVRAIDHPNVVDIIASGTFSTGQPYLAMELLVGRDLDDTLRRRGRMEPGEVLELLEPLCSALSVAHRANIVHRDLKASNVFLAGEQGAPRVVLLDFGVAKLLDDAGPRLTTSRHVIGTPLCMAPEQITGSVNVDARADVYALGALVYQMLTGATPFADVDPTLVQHMHLYASPSPPSALAPVPRDVDAVLLRAMSKPKEHRQASVEALLEELRAAIRGKHREAGAGRSVLVRVEIAVEERELDAPDEALLDDIDEVFSIAETRFCAASFELVLSSSTALSFAAPLSAESALNTALDVAAEVERQLARRAGRDPRVGVVLAMDVGLPEAVAQSPNWRVAARTRGLVVSRRVADEAGRTCTPVHPGAVWFRVVRT